VVHDILTLAELQTQLFKTDAHEAVRRAMTPLCLFASGLVLLVTTIPVILIAIAVGLTAAGLSAVAAYALVSIVALVVAVGMSLWAWRRLCKLPPALARSRVELARNIVWIKDALTQAVNKPQGDSAELRNDRRN